MGFCTYISEYLKHKGKHCCVYCGKEYKSKDGYFHKVSIWKTSSVHRSRFFICEGCYGNFEENPSSLLHIENGKIVVKSMSGEVYEC